MVQVVNKRTGQTTEVNPFRATGGKAETPIDILDPLGLNRVPVPQPTPTTQTPTTLTQSPPVQISSDVVPQPTQATPPFRNILLGGGTTIALDGQFGLGHTIAERIAEEQVEPFELSPEQQQARTEMMDLVNRILSGEWLSAETNPYLQGAIQAAIDPVTQQLKEQILPRIGGQAAMMGAFGGTAMGNLEEIAVDQYIRDVTDIASKMYLENYQRERDIQLAIAPQLQQMLLAQELGLREVSIEDVQRVADRMMELYRLQYPGGIPPEAEGDSALDWLGLGFTGAGTVSDILKDHGEG